MKLLDYEREVGGSRGVAWQGQEVKRQALGQ